MEKVIEERNNGVTIAKALAIILMVLGHSGCPEEINHFLGIMRMPLFFMMSGYCFKAKYIDDGKKYLMRRVNGVYKPYVKWGLFFLLMHNVFCYVGLYRLSEFNIGTRTTLYTISETLHRVVTIILCLSPEEELIGGFWFLHDLFWGSFIFYFALKIFRKVYISIPVLFCLTIFLSFFDMHLSYFVYPRTILASIFITSGYAFKKSKCTFEQSWLYIICITVVIAVISMFWYSNLLDLKWKDIPLYTILAILGSLMLFGIGEHISKMSKCWFRTSLEYVGSKTFNVLTWHMLSFKLLSLLIINIYGLTWAHMADFTTITEYSKKGWFIFYFAIGVVIPVIGSLCYDQIKSKISHEK